MKSDMKLSYLARLVSVGLVVGLCWGSAGHAVAEDLEAAEMPAKEVDPWQKFNRRMFAFNDGLDKYLLRPLAVGYKAVMPDPLERGISNIFDNILEVPSTLNGLLQANMGSAAHDAGRFLVNSTLGLGGLLDVAQYMNLPADDFEDFGQTLAVWGLGSGPYVVLPFLGPSTVRDGFGRPVDWYLDPTAYIEHVPTYNTVKAVSLLDTRASLLSLEKNITGDKYTFIRDVYLQRREYLIQNGKVDDGFGAEDDIDLEEF